MVGFQADLANCVLSGMWVPTPDSPLYVLIDKRMKWFHDIEGCYIYRGFRKRLDDDSPDDFVKNLTTKGVRLKFEPEPMNGSSKMSYAQLNK